MLLLSIIGPYTVYSFRVVARTSAGEGFEFSQSQNFSTEEDGTCSDVQLNFRSS